MDKERKITIYALCDPDTNEVRYIGQTNQPDKRLRGHVLEAAVRGNPKDEWIYELGQRNKLPIFVVLHVADAEDADEIEINEIRKAKAAGVNLFNRNVGANGGVGKQSSSPGPITAVRLPPPTRKQLEELTTKWNCSTATLLSIAIDRMHKEEIRTMTTYSRRQHLIEAIAGQIDLILDQPELIEAKNKAGFSVDVRWRDGEYISDSDWTRVEGVTLSPAELEQAKEIALRPY